VVAQEQRRRVAGVDPPQHPGVRVELGQDAGREVLAAELLGHHRVEGGVGRGQAHPGATAVAVRRHRERRQPRGVQPVPDGVEDREVDGLLVDGVVEGVAAVLVRRLHQRRDHQPVGRERRGRQHRREELGAELERPGALDLVEGVAVVALGQQHLGGGVAVPLQQPDEALGQAVGALDGQVGLDRAEPVGAVDERDERTHVGLDRRGEHLAAGERAADHRALDVLGAGVGPVAPRHRHQRGLLEVDEVDDDVLRAERRLQLLGDDVRRLGGSGHVGPREQALEEAQAGVGVRVVHGSTIALSGGG
jgi:hypothetical protein